MKTIEIEVLTQSAVPPGATLHGTHLHREFALIPSSEPLERGANQVATSLVSYDGCLVPLASLIEIT